MEDSSTAVRMFNSHNSSFDHQASPAIPPTKSKFIIKKVSKSKVVGDLKAEKIEEKMANEEMSPTEALIEK